MPTATAAENPRTFRELVIRAGFRSVAELAAHCAVKQQTLHYIGNGYRPASPLRRRLCRALKVSASELLAAIATDSPRRRSS